MLQDHQIRMLPPLPTTTADATEGGKCDTAAGTGTTMGASTNCDKDDNVAAGKRSSDKSKRDVKKRQQLALLEATKQYQWALKKRQEGGLTIHLMHDTQATIIGKAKALNNVENFTIHPSIHNSEKEEARRRSHNLRNAWYTSYNHRESKGIV
jgi:hypothetical protein